ncbi:MAG: hypothetical protein ABI629_21670 [bacterium]
MPIDASLHDRLAHLERSQRRLQRIVLALIVTLAATLLIGAADERALEGRSLKLTDDAGHVRVLLTANNGVSLLDANGTPRAVLSIDGDGPGLVLSGATSRAILNINQDGPALAFTGTGGRLRSILAVVKGDPGLVFFDADEHERVELAVRGSAPHAALRNANGSAAWQAPAAP